MKKIEKCRTDAALGGYAGSRLRVEMAIQSRLMQIGVGGVAKAGS